jgi:hypothetical protein
LQNRVVGFFYPQIIIVIALREGTCAQQSKIKQDLFAFALA